MKCLYSGIELSKLSFADSSIKGLLWQNTGNDLSIILEWLPPVDSEIEVPTGKQDATLECHFVTDLKCDFNFKEGMGYPFIFQLEVTSIDSGRWDVKIRFIDLPEGNIHFECDKVMLKIKTNDVKI